MKVGSFSFVVAVSLLGLFLLSPAFLPSGKAAQKESGVMKHFHHTTSSKHRAQSSGTYQKSSSRRASRASRGITDFTWHGGHEDRISRIRVDLSDQRIYVYDQYGDVLGRSSISSGKPGYGTPTGLFRILNKSRYHRSNLYGQLTRGGKVLDGDASSSQHRPSGSHFIGSPMPYFMRLTSGGVGFHSGFVTGSPVSHGCIRLPKGFASKLFQTARSGTPVEIVH